MNRERRKRYYYLKSVRKERDYHSGKLQFEGRPITKPTMTIRSGYPKLNVVTTKEFMA